MPATTITAPTEADARRIQEVLDDNKTHCPGEVRRFEVEFGEDWAGHPAIYLNLIVPKDLDPTPERIARLNQFIRLLHDALIDLGTEFWPYSRIVVE